MDIVGIEEVLRVAGIFSGDTINAFERFDRARSDVLKIADGSRNDIKHNALLDGHRLGEITRLVNITAKLHRDIISEKL